VDARHAEMTKDIHATHALRLGFREIAGFPESHARAIENGRGEGFASLREFWLKTGLPPSALRRLAQADAFGSLGLTRREALWALRSFRRVGEMDDLPLFARAPLSPSEQEVELPPTDEAEEVIEDYRHLSLSLKAHPLSFLRPELAQRRISPCDRLGQTPSGKRIALAGLVLVRQRPGSAQSIFMTIEDETAIANIIVWPQIFERFRRVVMGARLVAVTGKVQNESGVVHVLADRLDDLTPLLHALSEDGNGDSQPRFAPAGAPAAMPKGRNFH
jgi:error-prone DNA polymerase